MVQQFCLKANTKPLAQLCCVGALGLVLSGCASISVPFGNLLGDDEDPMITGSIAPLSDSATGAQTSLQTSLQAPLPEQLSAVAPVDGQSVAPATTRPEDDLIASMPSGTAAGVSLTQSDLNAMGRALTYVLESEDEAGTFSWSHETTGRSGLMTPFRQLSRSDQGACRVVSIEITDGDADKILLGDACQRDGQWVFVSPQAGQIL